MFVLNHFQVTYELHAKNRVIGGGIETISIGRGVEVSAGLTLISECISSRLRLASDIKVIVTALDT